MRKKNCPMQRNKPRKCGAARHPRSLPRQSRRPSHLQNFPAFWPPRIDHVNFANRNTLQRGMYLVPSCYSSALNLGNQLLCKEWRSSVRRWAFYERSPKRGFVRARESKAPTSVITSSLMATCPATKKNLEAPSALDILSPSRLTQTSNTS